MFVAAYLLLITLAAVSSAEASPSRLAPSKIIARHGSLDEDVADARGRFEAVPERDRALLVEVAKLFPVDEDFDRFEREVKAPSEHQLKRIAALLHRDLLEHTDGKELKHVDRYNAYYARLVAKPCEAIRWTYNYYWEICDSDQFGLNRIRDLALVCTHILLKPDRRDEFHHRITCWRNKLKGLVRKKSH